MLLKNAEFKELQTKLLKEAAGFYADLEKLRSLDPTLLRFPAPPVTFQMLMYNRRPADALAAIDKAKSPATPTSPSAFRMALAPSRAGPARRHPRQPGSLQVALNGGSLIAAAEPPSSTLSGIQRSWNGHGQLVRAG